MFVRKKKNKSGTICVQVISKNSGKYIVVKTFGSSCNLDKIKELVFDARQYISNINDAGKTSLFPLLSNEDRAINNFIKNLSNASIRTKGPELIFGTLFDRIGFNKIKEELFRHITIARLAYPTSKLKTVDYLYRYNGISIDISKVYRFLDRFHRQYKEEVEKISYQHSKKRIGAISVVFYDMTTLYFDAEDEDDLRKIGFSKDGKFQCPQIMIGLLVGENGWPIGYDIFEGNTFEGHTLIPIIEQIQRKYSFPKPVVIADAGLLSKKNLAGLSEQKYKFILGARVKNESSDLKKEILEKSKNISDGESFIIHKKDNLRLVISYSDKRARKDKYNREKGIKKLEKRVKTGRLTKSHVNNRGYNKFLTLDGEIEVKLDESKMLEDVKWDGLKGYNTNTDLDSKTVINNYNHLWQIEKAFRMSKSDLRIRPIFHRKRDRIEAHVCISFVAYSIYKELEQLLYKNKAPFSVKKAAELTHNMYELEYKLNTASKKETRILNMDNDQKLLYEIVNNFD